MYDDEYREQERGRTRWRRSAARSASPPRTERGSGRPPPPDRRRPGRPIDEGYTGPGELGRYGNAPVPYGPDHTYDYHFGDRYGAGPDFVTGEERIRKRPLPELRRRRGPYHGRAR